MASSKRSVSAKVSDPNAGAPSTDKSRLAKDNKRIVAGAADAAKAKGYSRPDMTGDQGFDQNGGGPASAGWSKRRGNVG